MVLYENMSHAYLDKMITSETTTFHRVAVASTGSRKTHIVDPKGITQQTYNFYDKFYLYLYILWGF